MKATTNVRRMIKRPSPAMAAGVRQRDAASPRLPSLSSNTGNQQSLDVFDRLAPLPTPRTAARDGAIVQRKPRESETGTPVQDVTAVPLILDDDSEQLGPRQMRKSDFLAMLRTAVCAAVDEELASTGRSSKGCPHVDFWFTRAAGKPAAHVEQALRRFAPESIDAASAADFVPVVVARVRQSVATWAETGAITGVPEDLPRAMGGSGSGEAESNTAETPSAAEGETADVALAARAGGAGRTGSPAAVLDRLGPGQSLETGVRSRMESAFGAPFGDVRVHTDASGARLSQDMNARAFTVGTHVAFDPGEYRPGTMVGDALLAHELAHVLQQRGGDRRRAQRAASDATGGLHEPESRALEEDADRSAVQALAQGVDASGRQQPLSRMWPSLRTRLTSGLRLQRCGRERCPPGEEFFPKAGMGIGSLGPGMCRWECWPVPPEEQVEQSGPSIGEAPPPTIFDHEPTAVTTPAFFNANTGTCFCSPPKDPETDEPLRSGEMIDCESVGIPTVGGKGGRPPRGRSPGRRRPPGGRGPGRGTGKGHGKGARPKGSGKASGSATGKGPGKAPGKKGATDAEFLKSASRQELVDFVGGADALREMSKKLHAAIPSDIAQGQRVVAIGLVREGPGHPPRLVCTVSGNRVKDIQAEADKLGITVWSVPDSSLRATGRASKKTPHVPGAPGDAEQRLLEGASLNGMKVVAAVPSKKACADCVSALQAEGVLLIDPAP